MKLGKTLGCMAAMVGGLLVTLSSVSADHFIAGGVLYAPTASNLSKTAVQCRFFGVKSRVVADKFVIPTTIQCHVVHQDGSKSFELSLFGTALESFTVDRDRMSGHHTITLKGMMRSLLVGAEGEDEHHHLTELARFTAIGVHVPSPGKDRESLSLTLGYSARKDIGPLLAKALGPRLVTCDRSAATCTVTLAGDVIDGEIESHTADGE